MLHSFRSLSRKLVDSGRGPSGSAGIHVRSIALPVGSTRSTSATIITWRASVMVGFEGGLLSYCLCLVLKWQAPPCRYLKMQAQRMSAHLVGNYHMKDVVLLLEIIWAHVRIRQPQVDQRIWKIDWQQVAKVFSSSNSSKLKWSPRSVNTNLRKP